MKEGGNKIQNRIRESNPNDDLLGWYLILKNTSKKGRRKGEGKMVRRSQEQEGKAGGNTSQESLGVLPQEKENKPEIVGGGV